MMKTNAHTNSIKGLIETALKEWLDQEGLPINPQVVQAKKPYEGQYTTTVAFQVAKSKGASPQRLGESLAQFLNNCDSFKGLQAKAVDGFVNVRVDLTLSIQVLESLLSGGGDQLPQMLESARENKAGELPYWVYRAHFLSRRLSGQEIEDLSVEALASILETPAFHGVRLFIAQGQGLACLQNWLVTLTQRENLLKWSTAELSALKRVTQWLLLMQDQPL